MPMRTLVWLWATAPVWVSAAEPVDYVRQVKPLLAGHCYACHAGLKQENNLRLDTAASIRRGGDSGPAVVAGHSGDSLLVTRVSASDVSDRMPPEHDGTPLKANEIDLIRAWIDQGAIGPTGEQPEADPREHWAFRPPQRPPVPSVANVDWLRNPIDAFIARERERQGVRPQPPAGKRTWLRRVYLDLIGLPPTAQQQERFLADSAPDADEREVDRLLASPQYAERWGRHWMDVWRYSDWWGLGAEVRNSQKHMWHWRDWIVESLAADTGYDEMLRQMLAADELYPDDLSRLRATGYLARQYFKFNRNTWLEETVEHTSKAFLGLTLNCAKCHDHKYDPFVQKDFYRLRAFFEPYQIRMEQVPGEVDFERDGIPRAFDCNLDAPTYRFERGNENRPITDEPVAPGLPALLEWGDLRIEPVVLPVTAQQPGLRPWVLDNYLAAAQQRIAAARQTLAQARNDVAAAERATIEAARSPPSAAGTIIIHDDFGTPRDDWWEPRDGQWQYVDGCLRQSRAGVERAAIRLRPQPPDDFEARMHFTITGGQIWKSVGLAWDVDADNEVLAYLSAYADGPKLQIAYRQGTAYTYPDQAVVPRPINLGESQELVVRVRGTLINVELNGKHVLAWRSPLPRRKGAMELMTYDAQATLSEFQLATLPDARQLVAAPESSPGSAPLSLELARAAQQLAERSLAAAEAQPAALRARATADTAQHAQPPDPGKVELARAAACAERQAAAAQAAEAVARAEWELLRSGPQPRKDKEKALAAAREALEKATRSLQSPGEAFTPLAGALKTPESNLETAESRNRPFPSQSTGRRSALARWLTDRRNPLVARVAVNHVWMRHFNQPLVPTVFDFGRRGQPPTHPELLDWLAVELMDNGWSLKHLHRLIVTSNTYRLSSSAAGADDNIARDPENHTYWRMNAGRMEAQLVRDSLLYLAGDLDLRLGGPPLDPDKDELAHRRSLYFVHSHNEHHRFLELFDDAGVLECYRREQSIVPQQALVLSNSRQAIEAAERLAEHLDGLAENSEDDAFVRSAFISVLAAEPNAAELAACRKALAEWMRLAGDARPPSESRRRARASLVHALLNHNDFVTVR